MAKIVGIKSDYSTDPNGTAVAFEIAARDRDVDIAMKELQSALKAGEEIARDRNASLSVIVDSLQNITDAKLELVAKMLRRLMVELEGRDVIFKQNGTKELL